MEEEVDGLVRKKMRPSRILLRGAAVAEKVVRLTLHFAPGETGTGRRL